MRDLDPSERLANIESDLSELQEALREIRSEAAARTCICETDNPCDYHAVTCVTCGRRCKGNPSGEALEKAVAHLTGAIESLKCAAHEAASTEAKARVERKRAERRWESLVSDAAEAVEIFGDDELERLFSGRP